MSKVEYSAMHHVQLAMPEGGEAQAREFWAGVLGLEVVHKPPVLAARGGCWFRGGGIEIHVGADLDFVAARKAHPGILVEGLDEVAQRLKHAGTEVQWDPHFPGYRRFYANDPFGNRLEFLEES